MNESIKQELKYHLIQSLKDRFNDDCTNFEELHHVAFNEDYYIIGYYQASEWLKSHDVDAFEAIAYVIEQENNHFGESNLKAEDMNSERIVNLLVYFAGLEIMPCVDLSDISKTDLLAALESE
jgi:hypothetical protein